MLSTIEILSIIGIIASGLLGTGAVAFFVKYGTRLALLERMLDSSNVITLHPRLVLVESAITEFKAAIQKLSQLDVMNTKLDQIQVNIKERNEVIVPRDELDVRFNSVNERMDALQEELRKHP